MNDLDAEERRLLREARRAWSPSASAAERVLRAVQQQVAGAPPDIAESPEPSSVGQVASVTPSVVSAAKLVTLLVIASGVGVVSWSLRPSAAPSEENHQVAPFEAANAPAPADAVRSEPRVTEPREPSPAVEGPQASASAPRRSLTRATSAGRSRTRDERLRSEVARLHRIERALRDGDAELALRLVAELERAAPSPHLAQERAAAALVARCQLQTASARAVAAFSSRYPNSPYALRIAQACKGAK